MKRIGLAASKMAKGNIVLYNIYVVLISFLFSLFIFIVAGCTIIFALIIISYISTELMLFEFEKGWASILALWACSTYLLFQLI